MFDSSSGMMHFRHLQRGRQNDHQSLNFYAMAPPHLSGKCFKKNINCIKKRICNYFLQPV